MQFSGDSVGIASEDANTQLMIPHMCAFYIDRADTKYTKDVVREALSGRLAMMKSACLTEHPIDMTNSLPEGKDLGLSSRIFTVTGPACRSLCISLFEAGAADLAFWCGDMASALLWDLLDFSLEVN